MAVNETLSREHTKLNVLMSVKERALGLERFGDAPLNYTPENPVADSCPAKVSALVYSLTEEAADFCLICIDLLWLSDEICQSLRQRISKRWRLPPQNICLCASHTHGSPNTEPKFNFEPASSGYLNSLKDVILDVVDGAFEAKRMPASLYVQCCEVPDLSINRRRKALFIKDRRIKIRVQNLPNPTRTSNNQLVVINFKHADTGRCLLSLVNYACHPVTSPASTTGADYPGWCRAFIHEQVKDRRAVMFLQGFCGDIRPALFHKPAGLKDHILEILIGRRFRKSKSGDDVEFGRRLAEHFLRLAGKKEFPVSSLPGRVKQYSLPLILDDKSQVERNLMITQWPLGDITLLFLSGEILSGYAQPFTPENRVIHIGYSNGMCGYIPTAKDLPEGGYEVDGSRERFNLPRRVSKEFCDQLMRVIKD